MDNFIEDFEVCKGCKVENGFVDIFCLNCGIKG